MFTTNTNIVNSREELSFVRTVESIIQQLSNEQTLFSDQKDITLEQVLITLDKWANRIQFPRTRDIDPRRSEPLDEYLSLLAFALQRDLTRILSLYGSVNEVEQIIEAKTNSAGRIVSYAKDLMVQAAGKDSRTSILDETITEFDFRDASHVESGTFFHEPSAGIITTATSDFAELVPTETVIAPNRNINTLNPYTTVGVPEAVAVAEDTEYYDPSNEILRLSINKTSQDPFTMLTILIDMPFEIETVEADISGNGVLVDITSSIIGNSIIVKGEAFALPSPASITLPNGNSTYSLWFPENVYGIKATIKIEQTDVHPVQVARLIDNHGNVMRQFTVEESLLINKEISGIGHEEQLRKLNIEIKDGILDTASDLLPLRKFNIISTKIYSTGSAVSAEGRVKMINLRSAISSVELFVDAYDPEGTISYFIDSTRKEKLNIYPSNLNVAGVTKVEFSAPYPTQISVIIEIPSIASYRPTIGGLVVRAKEVIV